MAISLNTAQLEELKKTLKDANLSPQKKRRLLWRMGRATIPVVKRNIRKQENINGEGYAPRKRDKKRNKKMLTGLPKHIRVKQNAVNDAVKLIFVNYYQRSKKENDLISVGVVAKMQQEGKEITVNKSSFSNQSNSNERGTVTKSQIKKLRSLGYKININGKMKKASQSWIKENLSRAQAGLIITKMNGKQPRANWKIKIAARSFLGLNNEDFSKILARELKNIEFGFDVKAQDIKNRGK